jgi:hypothetical protein
MAEVEKAPAAAEMEGQYYHTDGDPSHFIPETDVLTLENVRSVSNAELYDPFGGEVDSGNPSAKDEDVEVCLKMY